MLGWEQQKERIMGVIEQIIGKDKGDLMVWHIQNPPSEPFVYLVGDADEAARLINELADKDLKNPRVTDNAFGLVEWDGEEWTEWYSPDGDDIHEYAETLNL